MVNPSGSATAVPMKKSAMSDLPTAVTRDVPDRECIWLPVLGRDCDRKVRHLTQRSVKFGSWLTPRLARTGHTVECGSEAGQILISPRVLMKVESAVKVEPVGEFELKGIRRPLAAYNVVRAVS
jgi:hypothetical protein